MIYKFSVTFFSLSLMLLSATSGAEERPMFQYKGFDYSTAEFPADLLQRLYDKEMEHYKEIESLMGSAILDIYFTEEAKKSGKTADALRHELLEATPPDEKAMRRFYEQNKQRLADAPYEKIKAHIAAHLNNEAQAQKEFALLEKIKTEGKFKLLVPKPVAPFVKIDAAGYPVKGKADAPITIIEFADYQCPHCQKAGGIVKKLLAEYPGKIKLIFMDLPINRSGISTRVAQGAVCAGAQGKFWEYHDAAFAMQKQLTKDSPQKLATDTGLDIPKFDACFQAPETLAKVEKSKAEATRLGLNGTPSFFVNGKPVKLYDVYEDLRAAIEAAL